MKYIILIILSLFFLNIKAQNLIVNGSAENFSNCLHFQSDTAINNIIGWYNPTTNATPDYFNPCDSTTYFYFFSPNNFAGFQYARTGETYAGFATFGANWAREYIGISINQQLTANKTYKFRVYVSNAGLQFINTHYNAYYYNSIDSMGVYFTDSIRQYNTSQRLNLTPQIYDTTGYISDTVNWHEITGTFVATGNEHYLIIGDFNYRTYSVAYFLFTPPIPIYGYSGITPYYYLDDVALWPADTVPPAANASPDTTICRGGKARLGTHNYGDYIYEWWPAATLSNDSGGVVWASPDTTTTYYLQATDDIYTKTMDSVTVFVNNCGQNDTVVCVEQQFVMGSTNNPLWNYQWLPSTWLSSDTVGMPLCNPMANQNYQLLITNAAGDTIALDSTIMIVGSCYYAQAGIDSLICKSDSLQIGMQHYSFIDYAWSPNFMISDTAVGNPTVWPDTLTWYFLQVVDTMGNISYDSVLVDVQVCIGIQPSATLSGQVKVYPNPASDIINIDILDIKEADFILYNSFGQEVMQISILKGFNQINIKNLSEGIYYYSIKKEDIQIKRGKLILL